MAIKTILFVCRGNIFRSAVSAHMLKAILKKRHLENKIHVDSAGLISGWWNGKTLKEIVLNVEPNVMPANLLKSLERIGIKLTEHRTKKVNKNIIEKSSLIFVFEKSQRNKILVEYPDARDKTFVFKEFIGHKEHIDMEDPKGKSLDEFLAFAREMRIYLSISVSKIEKFLMENNYNSKARNT